MTPPNLADESGFRPHDVGQCLARFRLGAKDEKVDGVSIPEATMPARCPARGSRIRYGRFQSKTSTPRGG